MPATKTDVLEALRRVKGPDLDGNLVDLGLVSEIIISGSRVSFAISIAPHRARELEPLRKAAEKVVGEVPGVSNVTAVLTAEKPRNASSPPTGAATTTRAAPIPARAPPMGGRAGGSMPGPPVRQVSNIPGVKNLIAVASGKGGVGKSTTAVNLALGFQALGLRVGILDADIFGPSQPRLLGLRGRPEVLSGTKLRPMEAYGLQAMSMGFLVDEGTPIIWRGPMVVSALNQMLREVGWGDLDVMVIDMPPGTGDVQLTMAQQVPLAGAIIVSTPQDLALIDARKGLSMFRKVDVPVLGIVENMSMFICPKCGERSDIFGHGGARQEAEKLGVPFLGGIPLHMSIRETSDAGTPIVVTAPDSVEAQIFREIAAKAWAAVEAAQGAPSEVPELKVSPSGDTLTITPSGGSGPPFELTAEMLRVMSPSAEVQGHSPEQRVTVGGKRNVKIKELRPVGNYAVRIVFDDRHDTGLFSWSYLSLLGREKEQRWADYLAELKRKGLKR